MQQVGWTVSCFTTIKNHNTLKHYSAERPAGPGFTTIKNHNTLKLK